MKRMRKITYIALCILLCAMCVPVATFAHSGRTDSSGGHHDNKNKSGLGDYHYHCGGYPAHLHENGYCPYTDILPSSVSISAEKTSLGIGEKTNISAAVSPSNAYDTSVSWSNSNPDVVTLEGGTIEAVGYGTSTLTATAINGKKTSITITVKEITADKVTIQEDLEILNIKDKTQFSATISPENVDNPTITWESSDETIATVDQEGNVEALAVGMVTISAKASNGVSDTRTIEVKEVVAEKIEIKLDSTLIHNSTYSAKVVFYPENTTFQDIEWKAKNEKIVKVDSSGNVKALSVGKTTITAIQKDVEASIQIEVIPLDVEEIEITSTIDGKLYLGNSAEFSAEVTPSNATYPTVYWKVEDTEIAEIDENGHLEAKALGKTVVIAYTEDGCEERFEIEIGIPPMVIGTTVIGVGAIGGIVLRKKRKNARIGAETVEDNEENL